MDVYELYYYMLLYLDLVKIKESKPDLYNKDQATWITAYGSKYL